MAIIKFSKKHKLKEDRFLEKVFDLRQKVQVHRKPLLIAAGVLAFAALVAILVFNIRARTNEEANALFGNAILEYQQGSYSNAISKLKEIVDGYGGSASAPQAVFLMGSLYYDLGNYQLAVEAYKKYIEKYDGSDFLNPAAYKGLGSAYMQLKDFKNAVEALEKAAVKYPDDFSIPEIRCKLARCLIELKDVARAKAELDRVVKDSPKSSFAREAELLLASL